MLAKIRKRNNSIIKSVFDYRFNSNKHTYMFMFVIQVSWFLLSIYVFFGVQSGFIWNHWMGAVKVWCCLVQVTQKW